MMIESYLKKDAYRVPKGWRTPGEMVRRQGLLIAAALWCGTVHAEPAVSLEFKYPEGRVIHEVTKKNNVTDAAGMRIVQFHQQEIERRVLSSDKNGVVLQLTYQRQLMTTESPLGSMSFDSAVDKAPPEDLSFTVLGLLVGQSFTVLLDENFQVSTVTGAERIAQTLKESLPKDLPKDAVEKVMASFTTAALKKLVSDKRQVLPNKAVVPGDTWSNSVDMALSSAGMMTTISDYTLRSLEEDGARQVAVIDYVIRAEMAPGNQLLSGFSVKGKGETRFDVALGMFIGSEVNIEMSGEIQGMPMNVSSNVTVTNQLH